MKVAVVGCGLAGLRSAMLLEARGHEVLLFEGRDRPGGRLHTAESGFEEGAEWVDEDHERMRGLVREVRVAEVPAPDGEYVLQFDGKRCLESAVWEDAARDLAAFEAAARNGPMGDSIDDLIDSVCKSAAGRWLVTANVRTDEGDEPARLGLAPWVAFRELYTLRGAREASAYRIGGGGSAFVGRLLERIACKPVFGARLLRVTQDDHVRLEFEGFTANADAAILALPLPCLLGVQIDPPLHNREALAKLGFAPAVKARFEFDQPFWKHGGWTGYMKSDLLLQQTWPDRENERALLAYIVGDNARTLEHNPAIGETLAREWKKWDAGLVPINTEIKNWTRDEFACGAFSLALPGSNPAAVRQRKSGNVQIAGEFCATWMGFMEGSLESAETAVAALS